MLGGSASWSWVSKQWRCEVDDAESENERYAGNRPETKGIALWSDLGLEQQKVYIMHGEIAEACAAKGDAKGRTAQL